AGDSGAKQFQLPTGFTFTYEGQTTSVLTAGVDGWLHFGATTSTSACCPTTIPTTSYTFVHAAPFWGDLHTNQTNNPPHGTIHWEYFDSPLPHVIVQWSDMEFFSSSRNPASLNFQTVLFASGDIEFRWGPMSSAGSYADGLEMIIGLQSWGATAARVVHNGKSSGTGAPVPGGLQGRSYYFFPKDLPLDGTRDLMPGSTMTYTLKAWNGHSEHELPLTIEVFSPAELTVWAEPAEPAPGESVTIRWEGANLSSLVIEDGSGNVVLTVPSSQFESGSLPLGPLAMGDYFYKFKAVGQ